jgi:hypothetical protein
MHTKCHNTGILALAPSPDSEGMVRDENYKIGANKTKRKKWLAKFGK